MTDFTNGWNDEEILTAPYAPLGLIAMPGCEELGASVNRWLMKWREHQDAMEDTQTPLFGVLGTNRENFLYYGLLILTGVGLCSAFEQDKWIKGAAAMLFAGNMLVA